MKLVLFLYLIIAPLSFINDIAEINALKKEAEEAYLSGNYEAAITKYNRLISVYGVQEDNVQLNLANAQFKNSDFEAALGNYSQLLSSNNAQIRSIAYNQMGLIAHQQKKLKEALSLFKNALKTDETNDEARYNYSVTKKKLEQQQKNKKNQDKKQQGQDKKQQNKQQQNKNKQGDSKKEEQKKEGEKKEGEEKKNTEEKKQEKPGEQGQEKEKQQGEKQEDTEKMPPSTAERLEEMSIPKEKAQMILEAMRNNEIKYLQQKQRQSRSNADNDKPYW